MLGFYYDKVDDIVQDVYNSIDEKIKNMRIPLKDFIEGFNNIDKELEKILTLQRFFTNKRSCNNAKLIKKIIYHIAKGVPEERAVDLSADELGYWDKEAYIIWCSSKKALKTGTLLFAKRYTACKLKKRGYKIKEIASILEVSENHVYKLLHENVDIMI